MTQTTTLDNHSQEEKTASSTEQPQVPEVPEVQEVQVMSPNVVVISDIDNPKAKWYIVHVYSGHENKVSEALRQRTQTLNLEGLILQTLIPTQEKIQIKRGQRKTVNEKIFPGYMLIKMEMTDSSWLAVRTTQGVTDFVGTNGNKPLPLSKTEPLSRYSPNFFRRTADREAIRTHFGDGVPTSLQYPFPQMPEALPYDPS